MLDYLTDNVRAGEETPNHIVSTTLAISLPLALLVVAVSWFVFS